MRHTQYGFLILAVAYRRSLQYTKTHIVYVTWTVLQGLSKVARNQSTFCSHGAGDLATDTAQELAQPRVL